MTQLEMTPVASEAVETSLPLAYPPCLMRGNPDRIDLSDESGEPPRLGRSGLHLIAGKRYKVHVWLQNPEENGSVSRCEVQPGEAIKIFFSPLESTPVNGQYFINIEPRNLKPIPAITRLTVCLHHKKWDSFFLSLPIIVWPTLTTRLVYLMTIVFALLGARFTALWQDKDNTIVTVLHYMAIDGWLWAQMIMILLFGMMGLSVIGLLWATYAPQRT